MAEKNEKKHVSDNAQLMAEWDWAKNNELGYEPQKLTCGCDKKVWWKCSKGHEWYATIASRNYGNGCPYCAGNKVLKGYNDLQTINPALSKEWNYQKNIELSPSDVMPNSDKKVWWICHKNHEWQAVVSSRHNGRGCPYCSNKKVLKGYNDLQTVNPNLAQEWNYDKNIELKPDEVVFGSNKKVWWKCSEGHEWQACIIDRNNGNSCPYCAGKKVLEGYNDLQTVNPNLAQEWNYDKNGRLKPVDVTAKSDKSVWWKCSKGHEWKTKIYSRSYGSGCPICSSERHTSFPEYALEYYLKNIGLDVLHSYKELGYELDLYIPSKRIAFEYDGYYWHKDKAMEDIEKNRKCEQDGIKLCRIREGLPSLNDSSIDYVIRKDQKDMAGVLKKVLNEIVGMCVDIDLVKDAINIENLREHTEKENSILFSSPPLAQEWNYDKNINLKPENYTMNSQKKVWWKCSKGHEWQATIANRNYGYSCPYCAGQKILQGYNDLQTLNPVLSKEWNYEKNGDLKPENVSVGSSKKVWWKCSKGHVWLATINHRNHGQSCPQCANKRNTNGGHNLKTANPLLASEWNYEKNGDLKPENVSVGSNKKVWWKCSKGHEWESRINQRAKGSNCPYCAGRRVLPGTNDLQTLNPKVAREWNYEKNNGLSPIDVMPNSHKNVYWKCRQGHEYQMTIKDRNRGCICPECAKQKRKKTK